MEYCLVAVAMNSDGSIRPDGTLFHLHLPVEQVEETEGLLYLLSPHKVGMMLQDLGDIYEGGCQRPEAPPDS